MLILRESASVAIVRRSARMFPWGPLFPLDGVPADLQGFHVLLDGVGRDAVGDGGLDGVEGDEAREVDERAEGDDVREERAADFLDGELRDGHAHDVREVRHLGHELLVEDEQAVGVQILVVFVRGLLRHGEHEIRYLDVRMVDGRVVDDDLGLRRAAARLRAVGLGLDGLLALGDGRLGEDDGGGDDALAAGA